MSRNGETFEQNLVATSCVLTRPDFPITVQNKHETSTFDHSSGLPCEQGAGGGVYSCLDVASPCCRLHLWAFFFYHLSCVLADPRAADLPAFPRSTGGMFMQEDKQHWSSWRGEQTADGVRLSSLSLSCTFLVFPEIYTCTHTHTRTHRQILRDDPQGIDPGSLLWGLLLWGTQWVYTMCVRLCVHCAPGEGWGGAEWLSKVIRL